MRNLQISGLNPNLDLTLIITLDKSSSVFCKLHRLTNCAQQHDTLILTAMLNSFPSPQTQRPGPPSHPQRPQNDDKGNK